MEYHSGRKLTMLSEGEKTQYFIDLYMAAFRGFYNMEFMSPPNTNSDRYKQLDEARKLVDKIHGEYEDFILFQFQVFKKMKLAPKPHHLVSQNSIKRYELHQKKCNIYNTEVYSAHGDTFIVKKSWRTYPFSKVLLPTSQDMDAMHAYSLSESKTWSVLQATADDTDALYYLEAKLAYRGAAIPKSIKKLLEVIK
jgi:hypothetical protein